MLLELENDADRTLADAGAKPPAEVRGLKLASRVGDRAVHLVLPKIVTDALGVPEIGEANVGFPDGRRVIWKVVGGVRHRLCGRDAVFKAIVDPDRDDALIGKIVPGALDLVADPVAGTCHPRDADAMIAEM